MCACRRGDFPLIFAGRRAAYQASLAQLPALAKVAAALGVRRTATWIMPTSDELTYQENFAFQVERLRPAAAVLAEEGVRLGLEYVAPKTLWSSKQYEFVHTMEQMAELCQAVGENAGFLLDSWHWYTAHETAADLRRLHPQQVVDVHVNDAPAGVEIDDQLDNVRDLPGATGVIDITAFLCALQAHWLRRAGHGRAVQPAAASHGAGKRPVAATAAALGSVWIS